MSNAHEHVVKSHLVLVLNIRGPVGLSFGLKCKRLRLINKPFFNLTRFFLVKISHGFITRYFLLGLMTHYCES